MEKFRGTIIWNNPYIIYSGSFVSSPRPSAFDELVKRLSTTKCIFLVLVAWSAENRNNAKKLVEWSNIYTSNNIHKIIFMANSELEAEAIRQEGGEAMFIHQNSLVDPTSFYVDQQWVKKYDAVYNAQFLSFKRHN